LWRLRFQHRSGCGRWERDGGSRDDCRHLFLSQSNATIKNIVYPAAVRHKITTFAPLTDGTGYAVQRLTFYRFVAVLLLFELAHIGTLLNNK